jgi:hypothetical protein
MYARKMGLDVEPQRQGIGEALDRVHSNVVQPVQLTRRHRALGGAMNVYALEALPANASQPHARASAASDSQRHRAGK